MYPARFIQILHLPVVPQEIIDNLPSDMSHYMPGPQYGTKDHASNFKNEAYQWSDQHNSEVDAWCKKNICADMYFAFQFITKDLKPHVDLGTTIKFIYLIHSGGSNVLTHFWDGDTHLAQYHVLEHSWHILKADVTHSVTGVEPGKTRWAITGRIF